MNTNSIEIIKKCKTFLVDCDGVIWTHNTPLPGAIHAIKKLRENGRRVIFVTNNSSITREKFNEKLQKLGFETNIADCFCTAYITARYLKNLNFSKNVYLIGTLALKQELEAQGIFSFGIGKDNFEEGREEIEVKETDNVGAVVVGYDKYLSFVKIAKAMCYLSNPSVLFIGTNTDIAFPMSNNCSVPGTGVILAAVKTACAREPIVLGKPSVNMFSAIHDEVELIAETTCMIGDRIDTDILFGADNNMKTVLVFSGVTTNEDYINLKTAYLSKTRKSTDLPYAEPDFVCAGVKELTDKLFN